jgi:hypothetical protein
VQATDLHKGANSVRTLKYRNRIRISENDTRRIDKDVVHLHTLQ